MKKVVFDFHGVIYSPGKNKIDTEVLEVIKSLHEQEVPLHIFTNSPKESLERKDKSVSFLKYFQNIVHEYSKPRPNSFRQLFDKIECEPSEFVLVDDSPRVIKAAKEYGIATIEYESVEDLKNNLEKFFDISLDS